MLVSGRFEVAALGWVDVDKNVKQRNSFGLSRKRADGNNIDQRSGLQNIAVAKTQLVTASTAKENHSRRVYLDKSPQVSIGDIGNLSDIRQVHPAVDELELFYTRNFDSNGSEHLGHRRASIQCLLH